MPMSIKQIEIISTAATWLGRIRSVQKSATCRMAGAIQKSPYRPWGFRGNYLPRWMASAPFGCRVFEQRRRMPAEPVARALARHINANERHRKSSDAHFLTLFMANHCRLQSRCRTILGSSTLPCRRPSFRPNGSHSLNPKQLAS